MRVEAVIIVGYYIGMYLSLCLAARLRTTSVVLVAPPRDLESVKISLSGISLGCLIPWAARHAYPPDLKLQTTSEYRTTGFNGVRSLGDYGGRIFGRGNVTCNDRGTIKTSKSHVIILDQIMGSPRHQDLYSTLALARPHCSHLLS